MQFSTVGFALLSLCSAASAWEENTLSDVLYFMNKAYRFGIPMADVKFQFNFHALSEKLLATPLITARIATQLLCQSLYSEGLGLDMPPDMIPKENDPEVLLRFWNDVNNPVFNLDNLTALHDESTFDPNKTTVIFEAGMYSKRDSLMVVEYQEAMRKAFLCRDDVNYFFLDHKYLTTNVMWAQKNVKPVAEIVGQMMAKMTNEDLTSSKKLHFIGLSMGARFSKPLAAKYKELLTCEEESDQKIDRMTLLDPSYLCYNVSGDPLKIDKDDVGFMDVIHTDNGIIGLDYPVGHVDFYPNGKVVLQPGNAFPWNSHLQAVLLFAESVISNNTFPALKCLDDKTMDADTCKGVENQMGYNADRSRPGIFYLTTRHMSPYREENKGSCDDEFGPVD